MQPLALVSGFTIHGLAVARALSRAGVEVHAFTTPAARHSPTRYTRYARVHVRDNLNSDDLVAHLLDFGAGIARGRQVVLFPTSDRMAAAIARGWHLLDGQFLLSWAHCRELVLELQMKDSLPGFAARAGILHPRSVRIAGPDLPDAIATLQWPCIAKPVQPLSSFKARIVAGPAELLQLVQSQGADLPFVVQELIGGDAQGLLACTAYLDHGRALCHLTSRKLAASPPGLGQGTVFRTEENAEVEALTLRFLAGLDLSGPVALEFKQDAGGRYWMIEPNVGRTEYCVDLAIQAGLNLPWIEYCHVTGHAPPPAPRRLTGHRTWYDTDKDPWCYLRNRRENDGEAANLSRPVFPFAGTGDWRPLAVSTAQQALAVTKDAARFLLRRG